MRFEKLLVFGPGSIGQKHIKAAREINSNLDVGLLLSRPKQISLENKNLFEFKTSQEALNWDPDLIIISTPANLHFEHLKQMITSKKNILLEKPIGHVKDNIKDWKSIEKLKKSQIQVGYQLRFNPCFQIIKNNLINESLGKLVSANFFCGSWLPNWREKNYRETVSANQDLGGGVLAELSHEIDLCFSLLGEIDLKWSSMGNSGLLDLSCEDNVHIVGETSSCLKVVIDLDFCSFPQKRNLFIRGNKGEINWDISASKLLLKNNQGEKILYDKFCNPNKMLVLQIEDLLMDNKDQKKSLGCSLSEGIAVLEFMQLIKNKNG